MLLRKRLWRPDAVLWLLVLAVLLLPVMMVSALSSVRVAEMKVQADEIAMLASGIRAYYADNVIARLQAADGKAVFSENYRAVHGGIPIPATLSIELGALFDNAHSDGRIAYGFVSDYPFAKRIAHPLDGFERQAIAAFRADPQRRTYSRMQGNGFGRSAYRLATPVLMRQACITCHNAHPDSPKRDWKLGDVRGIQEVTIRGIETHGFGKLALLMGYVGALGLTSVAATALFRRQSNQLARSNQQLLARNRQDASIAAALADQLREHSIFAHVVDHATFGITIADLRRPDQPLIYVNDAFCQITGYGRELAVGFNCRFLQGPDTDSAELERLREAIRQGMAYTGELVNYKADGTRFWNRLTIYPISSAQDGEPQFYVGNQVDITPLRQQPEATAAVLRQSALELEQVRAALDQADRFGAGLRRHLDPHMPAAAEVEAFLVAEQEAHRQLQASLDQLSKQLQRIESH
ncbi:MAG: PAS domain-containing protein [Cyanobium sp.]